MEELFKDLSKFARENRKALKLAEQWLNGNEFDGNLADAWDAAINELPPDWRKIVFIAWLASDDKLDNCKFEIEGFDPHVWIPEQIDFQVSVIFPGHYSTKEHPNVGRIRSALKKGEEKVKKELLPPINTKRLWSCPNLGKLREIDSNPNKDGIAGDKKEFKRLKEYTAQRGPKRKDIAETLYHEDGRIKTTIAHRSMFKQK